MTPALLADTNVWVDCLRARDSGRAWERLRATCGGTPFLLSSIVLLELWLGVAGRHDGQARAAALDRLVRGPVVQCAFDAPAAEAAAEVAAAARQTGLTLSARDAMIAGHARALGCSLISADVRLVTALPEGAAVHWSLVS